MQKYCYPSLCCSLPAKPKLRLFGVTDNTVPLTIKMTVFRGPFITECRICHRFQNSHKAAPHSKPMLHAMLKYEPLQNINCFFFYFSGLK
ncbi:hypothetical protein FKM82_006985 [Ascaphus truei]